MVNWDSRKLGALLIFLIGLTTLLLVNILVSKNPLRIDLTEEGRYTVSKKTVQILSALEDDIYIEVYLDGELPSGFKRLKQSIEETLEEFSVYGGSVFNYRFVDPATASSKKAKNEFYKMLAQKGIQATNVAFTKNGSKSEKLIFPGATINYQGKETSIMLLKGNKMASSEVTLNQSIENLEYELSTAIKTLIKDQKPVIGLVKGHQEIDSLDVASFSNSLLEKYDVFNVKLNKDRATLNERYNALIVAQPKKSFSKEEIFLLDQYVLNGGHLLLFIDALETNMDSAGGEGTFAFPYDHGLDDLLFSFGVRVNDNYLLDLSSGDYPIIVGNIGNQPKMEMLPWPFYPVINSYGKHPIAKNLDALMLKFVSTVDTISSAPTKKTPMIMSSPYTKVASAPVRVSVNDLAKTIDPKLFNGGQKAVGYLLEGPYNSYFKNKILPSTVSTDGFINSADEGGKVLVIGDGDFVRNEINPKSKQPLPLGFDPFKNQMYANLDLVLNTLAYMFDNEGLIQTRLKEVKIRPLDKVKIQDSRLFWQLLNLILPVALVILFGIGKYFIRRRKYTRFE